MTSKTVTPDEMAGCGSPPGAPLVMSAAVTGAGIQKLHSDHDHTLAKRLRASGTWAIIGRLSSVLFYMLLNSRLARALSHEDYGRYVLLESAVVVISLIALNGLPTVAMRLLRKHLVQGNPQGALQIVYASLLLVILASLVTALGTCAFAWLTREAVLSGVLWPYVLWALAWSLGSAALRLISELFRGYQHFALSYFLGGQRGGFGVNGALLLTAVALSMGAGFGLTRMLAVQVVVQGAFIVLGGLWLFGSIHGQRGQPLLIEQPSLAAVVREMVSRSWPLLTLQLVSFGLPELDTILVGTYMTAAEAAMYRPARLLTIVVSVPLLLVNTATQPFLAELHALGDVRRLTYLVRGSATLAAAPSLILVAAFLLFPELLLKTVFGADFVSAAPSLRVLALGCTVFVLTGSCGMVLQMTGHERSAMVSSVCCAAIYLLAAPWLVSRFGIMGAACSSSLLQVISNVFAVLLVYRHEKLWTTATLSPTILLECCRMIFPKRFARGHT